MVTVPFHNQCPFRAGLSRFKKTKQIIGESSITIACMSAGWMHNPSPFRSFCWLTEGSCCRVEKTSTGCSTHCRFEKEKRNRSCTEVLQPRQKADSECCAKCPWKTCRIATFVVHQVFKQCSAWLARWNDAPDIPGWLQQFQFRMILSTS